MLIKIHFDDEIVTFHVAPYRAPIVSMPLPGGATLEVPGGRADCNCIVQPGLRPGRYQVTLSGSAGELEVRWPELQQSFCILTGPALQHL